VSGTAAAAGRPVGAPQSAGARGNWQIDGGVGESDATSGVAKCSDLGHPNPLDACRKNAATKPRSLNRLKTTVPERSLDRPLTFRGHLRNNPSPDAQPGQINLFQPCLIVKTGANTMALVGKRTVRQSVWQQPTFLQLLNTRVRLPPSPTAGRITLHIGRLGVGPITSTGFRLKTPLPAELARPWRSVQRYHGIAQLKFLQCVRRG
jgi:hypothetical protein